MNRDDYEGLSVGYRRSISPGSVVRASLLCFAVLLVLGSLVGLLADTQATLAPTSTGTDDRATTNTPLPAYFENQGGTVLAYLRTRLPTEEGYKLRTASQEDTDRLVIEFEEFPPLAASSQGRPHDQVAHILTAMKTSPVAYETLTLRGVDYQTLQPNLQLVYSAHTIQTTTWTGAGERTLALGATWSSLPWWWVK